MKLAVVTNILTPYRIPLFEAISDRIEDFVVLLMAASEENREWKLKNDHRFKAHLLPGIHLKSPDREVALHWNFGVIGALRRANPDVVLSGGFAPANMAAYLYCRLFRKKFIMWGELTFADGLNASPLRKEIRRWLIRGADGSIASSSEAREVFLREGARKDRILTAVMPVDLDHFSEKSDAFRRTPEYHALRKKYAVRKVGGLGRPGDPFGPILLSVGRITSVKGYLELFKVYARILTTRPDVSLLIVGDGPDRPAYERLAQENGWPNVHFTGFVQAEDLPKFLAISDLFLFHTLYDPFGAVLSEAMAAGLPAVSSIHAAATHDLVEEGITGYRIDPRSVESSAAAVLKVLSKTPEERREMGKAGRRRVEAFGIEPSADAMVRFLESLLHSREIEGRRLKSAGARRGSDG